MPLIAQSSYRPPAFLTGGHAQTVFPTMARCVRGVDYVRERLEIPDGDFLDLDWSRTGSGRVAIVSHGLEGDSGRGYIRGMARALNRRGWDVIAWNFRSCSGEPNRALRLYHSGATDDLDHVVEHAARSHDSLALIGFSLGGNLTLKWLGEQGGDARSRKVCGGAVFSVPCDLGESADRMTQPDNRFYLRRFLKDLRGKVLMKAAQYPDRLSLEGLEGIRSFREFDDRYTAPLHGFEDAADYYARCSSCRWVDRIRVPTLLVNAEDDPFLTTGCFPLEAAKASADFFLERPGFGGHVGFVNFNRDGEYWSESRAAQFLEGAI